MKTFTLIILWLILFALFWPFALLALILWPVVWLISLPFQIIGILFTAFFALLLAIMLLPARLLGWRPRESKSSHSAA